MCIRAININSIPPLEAAGALLALPAAPLPPPPPVPVIPTLIPCVCLLVCFTWGGAHVNVNQAKQSTYIVVWVVDAPHDVVVYLLGGLGEGGLHVMARAGGRLQEHQPVVLRELLPFLGRDRSPVKRGRT